VTRARGRRSRHAGPRKPHAATLASGAIS
jgi:hypothetical protein